MTDSLVMVVTDAGRAALVNAQNNGTAPVLVATIGVTDQVFTATTDLAAIPGELKQLATISGAVTAADTIHVIITDDGADTYTLRGFGLYLDDGTLLASYGQTDAIMEKSAQATLLLSTDTIFANIDATTLTFGATNFLNPAATTDRQGVVELATPAEAITGTDATRAMTPAAHKAATDNRLGAGAPSAFVKSMLTAATAALFRAALSIKGAALYDTGEGKGLDADKLDGQHGADYRIYSKLTNVPAAFPPSAHQHSALDITSGTLPVARGGTGADSFPAGNYLIGTGTGALGSRTPAQVLANIGAAAASHSHAMSDINGLSGALLGKMATTWTLSAGAGLSGGGSGAANRTVSLGVPSTITASTNNSASGSTHTHKLEINKADLGLSAVNNTSDADKPVSTAQQAALNKKADLSGADFTGAVNHVGTGFGKSCSSYSNAGSPSFFTGVRVTPARPACFVIANSDVYSPTSDIFRIDAAGNTSIMGSIHAPNIETTASDKSLKHHIRRDRDRWKGIRRKIEMVLYDMRDGSEQDAPGVLAQEVQAISRDFVYTMANGKLAVRYSRLALACALDTEADARMAGMQRQMQELAERLANLERTA